MQTARRGAFSLWGVILVLSIAACSRTTASPVAQVRSPTATTEPTLTTTSVPPTDTPTALATPSPTFTPSATPTPVVYVVQVGDSLWAISRRFGVSVDALLAANGLDRTSALRPGQELTIPTATENLPGSEAAVPDQPSAADHAAEAGVPKQPTAAHPSSGVGGPKTTSSPPASQPAPERSMGLADEEPGNPRTETSKPQTSSAQPAARPTAAEIVHVVKAGENLSNIAIDYGASVDVIMVANGIKDPTKLRVGQKLVIPSGTATPVPTATANPTASPTPAMPYKPPSPLWPINGTKLPAGEPVVLSWTSVGILDPEEYYVVHLERLRGPIVTESWTQWLQQTSWRVPTSVRSAEPTKGQLYRWDIVVMRHTATDEDGTWSGIPLSNPSSERRFLWPLPLKQTTDTAGGSKVPGAPLPIPLSTGSEQGVR